MSGLLLALIILSTPADVGQVDRSFDAPRGCPTGLAWDGDLLWVADRRTDELYGLNPETGRLHGRLEAPGYWPTGLAAEGRLLWVADQDQKLAFRIDPRNGLATRTIELDLERPEGLAWDGTHLWCVDGKMDRLVKLDPEDGTSILSLPAPSLNPTGLAYDGNYLWVADRIDDQVYRVDPLTGEAVMRLPSPGRYPYGLAWVLGGLWCADYESDLLDRIALDGERKHLVTKERKASVEFVLDLINSGPGTVRTADFYVAVPENGVNQQLLGDVVFDPEPLEFVEDPWGQGVAHFRFEDIEAQGRVRVVMRCSMELREVLYLLAPERAGTVGEIPEELKERYLVDGSKYDIEHPYMKETVRGVVGHEKNVLLAAQKIYHHVMQRMRYELVGGWNAAPTVLKRGTGSCSEYTYGFIGLCRAAGIPARYAGSLVIRGDDASYDNVFHRWAEVYLPGYGWVPFDASRGDKDTPAGRLKGMGWLANTLFITTRGGGGSPYLGWTYNGRVTWTSKGKCRVQSEQIAEWEPLEEEKAETSDAVMIK
jgi:sugar lactone lactonase YvrE